MSKVLLKILQWLIHSNLYISIAATSFLWANILLLNLSNCVPTIVYIHVGASTWCVYQLSRWAYHKRLPVNPVKDSIYEWIDKNRIFMKLSIIISGILATISFFLLHSNAKIIVSIAGIISLLYPLSIKHKGRLYRLRDIPLIKIILIATVWSVSTVLLPSSYSKISFIQLLLLALQWIYILVITIPFDINDMETDKANNVLTLPLYLGYQNAVKVVFLLSAIYISGIYLWIIYSKNNLNYSYIIFVLGLLLMFSYIIIFTAKRSHRVPKWMIMAIYDGSMILYAIWVKIVFS